MKALKILNDYKKLDGFIRDAVSDIFLNEAIAELEALENRSCSSCQYAKLDNKRYLASHICLLGVNAIDFDFSCNKWESK